MRRSELTPPVAPGLDCNTVRADLVARLAKCAAAPPPPGLAAWSMPCAPLPTAALPTEADTLDRAVQTLNQSRVLHQYSTLLGQLCANHPALTAAPATCVLGLEWMSGLLQGLAEPSEQERLGVEQFVAFGEGRGTTRGETLFRLHATYPIYDRAVARMLLREHFPDSQEYEVDVCRCMQSMYPTHDYRRWLEAFPQWRDKGLLYPLAVSALYMRELRDWLPEQCWVHPLGHALMGWVERMQQPARGNPVPGLRAVEREWAADTTGVSLLLGHTLDRVAILMGVKSNARAADPADFRLAKALNEFPRSFGAGQHEAVYHAWHCLKACVEDAMPPSLLCAPLVRPRRPTWGFPALTLRVSTEGVVRFAETQLQPVAPVRDSEVHTHTPAYSPGCLSSQTSGRIQDVLWRVGEALLAPGMAACVTGGSGEPAAPEHLLAQMRPTAGAPPAAFLDRMARLEALMPPVHRAPLPEPCQLLLYRIDIPNRAIVYTGGGDEVRADSESQHHLQKLLLNSKVAPCNVGAILEAAPGERVGEATLRATLRAFAATGLRGHPSNTALVRVEPSEATQATPRQTTPVVHTTLAETVACFALTTPARLAVHRLNQSCAWQEGGIDPRYAERQDAENGFRFRDWVAMHAGPAGTQQSRLAAHTVGFDALYLTAMPWISNSGTRWVHVASTAPPVNRVLVGSTFRFAVESRFLHDPRMLPVAQEGQSVPRNNVELYAASDRHMAIVYAPDSSERLEMIAFGLDSADPGGSGP